MDLGYTADEIAFRDEVRAFLHGAIPATLREKMRKRRHLHKQDWVTWQRILNARGWAAPAWPVEWGGTGWSMVQRHIFLEELHTTPAPEPLSFNTAMIGPILIAYGSDAQKERFLPRIANLDDWWCQGFSEPGAGSDLASLRTSARRETDHYVVNGQKAWTTLAHYADWMFCLVRTDPTARKQEGISMLLIDMRSPGITVRPVITIDGRHETNEVFLDDVRVPFALRVGEENHGWTYAKHLLSQERTGIARLGVSKERVARIKELAPTVRSGKGTMADDAAFIRKLTLLEIEIKALEITQLRLLAAAARQGGKSDPSASILKIRGSELQQATSELLCELAGPMALADIESVVENMPDDSADGHAPAWTAYVEPSALFSRAYSIFGGSNEIQKNIIAKMILGL